LYEIFVIISAFLFYYYIELSFPKKEQRGFFGILPCRSDPFTLKYFER